VTSAWGTVLAMQRGDAPPGNSAQISATTEPGVEAVVDVVASNAALGMAARWLGMSADEARQEMSTAPTDEDDGFGAAGVKRPRFLGLGAKYLPHHKNVQFVAALDGKLRRRLERSRNDKGTDDDAGDKKRGGAQRGAFGGKGGPVGGLARFHWRRVLARATMLGQVTMLATAVAVTATRENQGPSSAQLGGSLQRQPSTLSAA